MWEGGGELWRGWGWMLMSEKGWGRRGEGGGGGGGGGLFEENAVRQESVTLSCRCNVFKKNDLSKRHHVLAGYSSLLVLVMFYSSFMLISSHIFAACCICNLFFKRVYLPFFFWSDAFT